MIRLLIQMGLVVLAGLAIGVAVSAAARQFPLGGLLSFLITSGLLIGCLFLLFRRLGALDKLAMRIIGREESSEEKNIFSRIEQALRSLEQQVEQKTVELANNQERFEAVLSGMDEGVIAIDDSSRVLLINRAARAMLSIDIKNVIGKPLAGLVRYEAVQAAARESLQTERMVANSFQTRDEKPREIKLRVAPMAGHPMPGITLVFHDVTDLTRLETIRRDFVANVSHELKTPLASIKGYAETLLMGAIDKSPQNRQFLEQINGQADLLNLRIHDLLQLARIESGREAFSQQAVDLAGFCAQCVAQLADEANKRNVRLSFENQLVDAPSCFVWADLEAIRTVYENLISNGVRYSHIAGRQNHQPTVRVVLRGTQGHAVVEVIDNGIGIAKEHQERVFERFFRVDPARSREQGGTGLGLAIVKHLIHSFGGQIELESKLGLGSTFRTILPRFNAESI
jgi:two-component system, OmpR family, phosphate regulon sensor histidine kinase PhoR